MDYLWAIIVVLLILFVLFVVLPSIFAPVPKTPILHVTAQLPAVQEQRAVENTNSRQMLDAHYQAARETVPENYPRKEIGACPYSKPPSTDLPMANVPMCIAVQTDNMHLRMPPLSIST